MPQHIEPTEISATAARSHGLAPVSIYVDAQVGSLEPRVFPSRDVYLKLNGPPGVARLMIVFDCTMFDTNVEELVKAKFVHPWARDLVIGEADIADVLGQVRTGVTFATERDMARVSWFGFIVECGAAKLLIAIGVSARGDLVVPASEVVSDPSIASVLQTMRIEAA